MSKAGMVPPPLLKAFEQREASADDLLRDVKESPEPDAMVMAINALIEGAGHEWDQRLSRCVPALCGLPSVVCFLGGA